MSLLIKALEKAEKDRQENAGIETAEPMPTSAEGLTLEPIAASPPPAEDVAISSLTRAQTIAAKPALASTPASPQAAAAVIRASQKPQNGVLTWISDHPRTLFFWIVGIFVAGYGAYLYLQIMHPALFIKRAPTVAAHPAPAPIIITPAPRTDNAMPASPTPKPEMPSSSPPVATHHHAHQAPATTETSTPTAIDANAGIATASNDTNTLDALLTQAWNALNAGNLTTAQQLYTQAQTRDPNNADVYLGLASIAAQQGDIGTATRDYMKVLDLDPRNAPAQAGLLNLLGSADPAAAETRLKQLIAQTPSPFLYSTLGNTYANQNRWAEAQQAYFEAYNRKPDNADYAYNLAVALEHINQPALAKNFYQRALDLANSSAQPVHFDRAVVQARVQKLSK